MASLAATQSGGGKPRVVLHTPSPATSSSLTSTNIPVRRHWSKWRMSPIGWQVWRIAGNSALWKTISHCTLRSGEKNVEACIGSWRVKMGVRGKPPDDRNGGAHSIEKSMRASGVFSLQPWFRISWSLSARSHGCARA